MQQTSKRVKEQGSLSRRFDTVRKQTLSVSSPLSTRLMVLAKVCCHHIDYLLLNLRCFSIQIRNNVQRWLSHSNTKDHLHGHQLEYMPRSCEYFLEVLQAQDCLNSKHSTTMRLQGSPGTGKTIWASFLVRYFSDQTYINVLYFFYQAGETKAGNLARFTKPAALASPQGRDVIPRCRRLVYEKRACNGRLLRRSTLCAYTCPCKDHKNDVNLIDALDESLDAANLLQALSKQNVSR